MSTQPTPKQYAKYLNSNTAATLVPGLLEHIEAKWKGADLFVAESERAHMAKELEFQIKYNPVAPKKSYRKMLEKISCELAELNILSPKPTFSDEELMEGLAELMPA